MGVRMQLGLSYLAMVLPCGPCPICRNLQMMLLWLP